MEYRSEEYEEKIRQLAEMYPGLSRRELEECEANFRAYLELVVRIYQRISKEPGGKERLDKLLDDTSDDQNGESPE